MFDGESTTGAISHDSVLHWRAAQQWVVVLNNKKQSGVYDLGTSNPTSFQHVAECVTKKYNGKIKIIKFPDHLVGKYQTYTCSKNEWDDYKFMTVEDYLK